MSSPVVIQDLTSREYKVVLDPKMFTNRKEAVEAFEKELLDSIHALHGITAKGALEQSARREIVFLDTVDQLILANGFVLRASQWS